MGQHWTQVEHWPAKRSPFPDALFLLPEGGRDQIGMVAAIKSVAWPRSNRNRWPRCIGIRIEAVRAGRSVYFSPLADIIDSLARAEREGRLRERIRFLCRSSVLIIDEIGYLSVGAGAGNLFFQLVNVRYELTSAAP
jgi:hypothetical protein